MPDIFAEEGSMEETVQVLESNSFEEAIETTIKDETIFGNDLLVQEISVTVAENDAIKPIIDAPDYIINGTDIVLLFKGANNTNGFIFGGIVEAEETAPEKAEI